MEGFQMCHLLWCVLLLLGASIQVCASTEAPEAIPSGTPGTPPKTGDELNGAIHNITNAYPLDDYNPTNTPKMEISDPSSDSTGSGSCFRWMQWEAVVLVGGAVLVATLLVSTVVLAVWVWQLKRQVHGGRPTRTNVDLVSGMGYSSSSRGGSKMGSREVVSSGHTEGSLKMEGVQQMEESKDVVEEEETAGVGRQQHSIGKEDDSGNGEASMKSSTHTGTASQPVGPPAGPSQEEVELLVLV